LRGEVICSTVVALVQLRAISPKAKTRRHLKTKGRIQTMESIMRLAWRVENATKGWRFFILWVGLVSFGFFCTGSI
jgi:hypothetical protein